MKSCRVVLVACLLALALLGTGPPCTRAGRRQRLVPGPRHPAPAGSDRARPPAGLQGHPCRRVGAAKQRGGTALARSGPAGPVAGHGFGSVGNPRRPRRFRQTARGGRPADPTPPAGLGQPGAERRRPGILPGPPGRNHPAGSARTLPPRPRPDPGDHRILKRQHHGRARRHRGGNPPPARSGHPDQDRRTDPAGRSGPGLEGLLQRTVSRAFFLVLPVPPAPGPGGLGPLGRALRGTAADAAQPGHAAAGCGRRRPGRPADGGPDPGRRPAEPTPGTIALHPDRPGQGRVCASPPGCSF